MTEHKLLGESDVFLAVLEHVSQLTRLNRPVLIVGERGTGKELIAERLHFLSDRWMKPLIKMNCAALSESLLESELFGHEAGAFTGAAKRHVGRFERADGGSLFLDELATMSLRTQEKILRFIEYGDFERVGGNTSQRVDVRLIAATNEDLPSLADSGKFRHDLLDRLAFDVITLPPLRERREDILLLAEFFAVSICKELGMPYFPGFSPNAETLLLNHPWPGNIRELKNVVERSVYRARDMEGELDEIILDPFASPFRPISNQREVNASQLNLDASHIRTDRDNDLGAREKNFSAEVKLPVDFKKHCREQEILWLKSALESARFNQREAAKLLGLTYHQLRSHLRKYHLI